MGTWQLAVNVLFFISFALTVVAVSLKIWKYNRSPNSEEQSALRDEVAALRDEVDRLRDRIDGVERLLRDRPVPQQASDAIRPK